MPLNMNAVPSGNKPNIERTLLPIGQHPVRLVQIIDLGLQTQRPYQGQEKKPAFEMYLTFEFPHERIEVEGESRPMWKSVRINLSMHEKSKCFRWYNMLDPENKYKGDWTKLIGLECLAFVSHNQGTGKHEGKTFDKISDISPVVRGMDVPQLENDPVIFDLTSPDKEQFEKFPEWIQNIIKENLEFTGSKLQRLLEGTGVQYTARAPGDGGGDLDADYTTAEEVLNMDSSDEDDDEAPY